MTQSCFCLTKVVIEAVHTFRVSEIVHLAELDTSDPDNSSSNFFGTLSSLGLFFFLYVILFGKGTRDPCFASILKNGRRNVQGRRIRSLIDLMSIFFSLIISTSRCN